MIAFGEWRPDVFDLNGSSVKTCQNVVPLGNSYGPWLSLTAITAALGAACQGAFMARKNDGSFVVYAGTGAALFRYDQASNTWTNVTRLSGGAYSVTSGAFWSFAQFGTQLVAVNANDVPQVIDVEAGSNFAALGGSPPQAACVTVIGSFLVLSRLTSFPKRIQWSALENIAVWTPGTSFSDYQDFPDGGDVVGVSGFETGFVIQKDTVRQMVFQPSSPVIFSFQRLEGARGCFSPYSLVNVGEVTFYYSNAGFYAIAGGQSVPIGLDAVDDFFKADASANLITAMQACVDPRTTRVIWGYTSTSNTGSTFDKIIGYDWGRKKWFSAVENVQCFTQAATLGYTLEGLDAFGTIDSLTISLDSPVWQGGVPALGAFNTSNAFGFFNGSAKEATIETMEVQLSPQGRAFVSGVIPYVDTSSAFVSVGGRERQQDATIYSTEYGVEVTGDCFANNSSRFHRAKVRIPSGTAWTKAAGVDFAFSQDGDR
jgi:hypothetical protein